MLYTLYNTTIRMIYIISTLYHINHKYRCIIIIQRFKILYYKVYNVIYIV